MKGRRILLFTAVLYIILIIGIFCAPVMAAKETLPKVGPVKINFHPASLEGKTVLLRWNGKTNGDKYLNSLAELITQKVKNVKIIKLWEVDKNTASISKNLQESEQTAATIARLKPNIVIASQAD